MSLNKKQNAVATAAMATAALLPVIPRPGSTPWHHSS